ncbi:hypothetical protein [Myceligenerans indicum]|uniref:Lipoprotein n=1 Tax=Myceligenerans indicum TaxID=2593663 RepID=A0ABS1LK00_9MICO|nr:hypothetical protein [Myceligenerans indicum]MBL0886570.1 hypothetical protein [Myceligenerans indicum]
MAASLLLTGCEARETLSDIAGEFGNARQVDEPESTPVAAPDPSAAGDPSASPSTPPTPEVLPSFDARSAVGDFAPGFPKNVVSVPDGAKLLATSAAPVAGSKPETVQVTLNLSAKQSPEKLLAQITSILAENGFEALDAPAKSGLTAQSAFTRKTKVKKTTVNESLLVGVLKDGDRSLLTLSGTVATGEGA